MIKIDSDNSDPDVRIELIPLIDVIFCILTFFILAAVTLTRQAALNVDLPSAKTGTTQMRQLLVVSVDPIGQTYVEKVPVTQTQLKDSAVKFRQDSPQGTVVLYASRASSYNDVIQVLDLLKSVEGIRVALATLPGGGQDPQSGLIPSGGQFNPISPATLPGLTNPSSGLNQNPLPGTGLPSAPSAPNSLNSPSTLPGLNAPVTQPGATSLPVPSGTSPRRLDGGGQ
jgi:biopolymer transport protein ExbD